MKKIYERKKIFTKERMIRLRKIIYLALALVILLLVGSCGGEKTTEDAEKNSENVEENSENEKLPQSDKYVTAAKDFSNLQLDDITKPVYDAYGVWDRQEKNLPMSLPEITPFQPADGEQNVYLTFDDGPDDKNTPAILDILKNENVPATFYVLGEMVEKNPDVLKRIFDEGHAIGNHSYNHVYKEVYASPWAYMEQFIKTDEIIMAYVGVRPLITRAPGGTAGAFDANYWEMIKSMGYVEHDWNIATQDSTSQRPNASTQINNILRQLGQNPPRNVILLMHSNADKEETVKALPEIIKLFKDWGYQFGVVTPMTPRE